MILLLILDFFKVSSDIIDLIFTQSRIFVYPILSFDNEQKSFVVNPPGLTITYVAPASLVAVKTATTVKSPLPNRSSEKSKKISNVCKFF